MKHERRTFDENASAARAVITDGVRCITLLGLLNAWPRVINVQYSRWSIDTSSSVLAPAGMCSLCFRVEGLVDARRIMIIHMAAIIQVGGLRSTKTCSSIVARLSDLR